MQYQWRAEITANQLDFLLVADYGKRNPSPVVDMVMEKYELPYDEQLTTQAMKDLADLMLMMYKPKWDKLGRVYDVEYDPIHNYLDEWEDSRDQEHSRSSVDVLSRSDTSSNRRDVESTRTDNLSQRMLRDLDLGETRTDNLTELETRNLNTDSTRTDNLTELTTLNTTDTRTDNLLETRNYGKTNTRTDNLTETKNYGKTTTRTDNLNQTDSGASGSNERQIQAFNSISYQNADKNIFTGEGSNTRHNTGTQASADSGIDTKVDTGTQGNVEGGSDSTANTGTSALARTGSETVANSGTQRSDTDETGTVTTANTGTQQKSGTEDEDTTVTNTGTQSNVTADVATGTNSRTSRSDQTDTGTESTERDGRHFGNIGNLTSQKQLKEEIELWKWNYVKEILNDAKEFLCLSTYLNY